MIEQDYMRIAIYEQDVSHAYVKSLLPFIHIKINIKEINYYSKDTSEQCFKTQRTHPSTRTHF